MGGNGLTLVYCGWEWENSNIYNWCFEGTINKNASLIKGIRENKKIRYNFKVSAMWDCNNEHSVDISNTDRIINNKTVPGFAKSEMTLRNIFSVPQFPLQ